MLTKHELYTAWEQSIARLAECLHDEFNSRVRLNAAKNVLAEARNAINVKYADNQKDLGANEAARNAKIADMTAGESKDVQEAEAALMTASLQVELARLEKERVKELRRMIVGVEVSS